MAAERMVVANGPDLDAHLGQVDSLAVVTMWASQHRRTPPRSSSFSSNTSQFSDDLPLSPPWRIAALS